MSSLSYEQLRDAVAGSAVGVRSHVVLEPLGGRLDKVFPPTYGADAGLRYAVERRALDDGEDGRPRWVDSVVLDSVASQANRAELVLLEAIRSGGLLAPVTSVDFAGQGLFGLDRISDYEAPHRIFDALLRDSFDGDDLFRQGPVGQAVTAASSRDAAAVYAHSPHTLVFGGWDSTGPKGGRGAKYERAVTSEIVAHDIQVGKRTSSRIDPAGIELKAGPVYQAHDAVGWTLDPKAAVVVNGKPQLYQGRSGDRPGRPSHLNHGNVRPSIDPLAGGVTAARIVGTTVLSFIQLRRLRFPTDSAGAAVPAGQRTAVEVAARTALAALGVAAVTLAYEQGFDLRSRCVLVATESLGLDLVGRAGTVETVEVDGGAALALVAEAAEAAAAAGLEWRQQELMLRPSDRLVDLIRRSQDIAAAETAEDDA